MKGAGLQRVRLPPENWFAPLGGSRNDGGGALAVQYYFGDLQYWKIPGICIEALEHGFDGRALRGLSGLMNPAESDIRQEEIDSAFREMGVNAPIPKEEARLVLATDAAKRALAGETNLFNEADPHPNTHLRIARSSARIAAYCCSFREVKTRRKLAMATRKARP